MSRRAARRPRSALTGRSVGLGCLVLAASAVTGSVLAAPEATGFLHGTVETKTGNRYTGLVRWDNEETFWDDLFNATKTDHELLERYGRAPKEERSAIRIFGITIGYRSHTTKVGRAFIARFGDIAEIRPSGSDEVDVTMRSGTVYHLEGGSNDVGAAIVVSDTALGQAELEWANVRSVRFSAAPPGTVPAAQRLQGRVITGEGTYDGYIQWDLEECLGTDRLDGETEDGDLSIEMRQIRAIEKHDRRGSWVELRDGRRLLLRDTNDVDSSLRGIFVEDARYGRVHVPWEAWTRAEFAESDRSGLGFDSYVNAKTLRGSVTDASGRVLEGPLVYDLDEAESWELLNGDRRGVEYSIPFSRIRTIERQGTRGSRVVLANGEILELEEGQDVSADGDGVLVRTASGEIHVPWSDMRRVELR
jgi:hypothetical protein